MRILSSYYLRLLADAQGSCPGNRLRPVVDTEFTIDIAGVDLDCVQREEKPGTDFLIG